MNPLILGLLAAPAFILGWYALYRASPRFREAVDRREAARRARPFLPQSLGQRIVLGLLAFPMFIASGAGVFAIVAGNRTPSNSFDALFFGVLALFIITVFFLTGLGLIWSVATPSWVKELSIRLASLAAHVTLAVFLTMVLGLLLFRP